MVVIVEGVGGGSGGRKLEREARMEREGFDGSCS